MRVKKRTRLAVIGSDSLRSSKRKRFYTIPELVKLAGLTRRQVDYWIKIRLITPTLQNGRYRGGSQPLSFFSQSEALKLLVFSDVYRRGFSVLQIRQLSRNIEHSRVRIDDAGVYLLTDSVSIYYARNDNEAIDLLKHHRQMLLIPIGEQMEKLAKVA